MAEKVSRSKAKRLNAKAKRVRIEAQVQEGKKLHVRAEEEARMWKERAAACKRYVGKWLVPQLPIWTDV